MLCLSTRCDNEVGAKRCQTRSGPIPGAICATSPLCSFETYASIDISQKQTPRPWRDPKFTAELIPRKLIIQEQAPNCDPEFQVFVTRSTIAIGAETACHDGRQQSKEHTRYCP